MGQGWVLVQITRLGFSFLLCKMDTITVLASWGLLRQGILSCEAEINALH